MLHVSSRNTCHSHQLATTPKQHRPLNSQPHQYSCGRHGRHGCLSRGPGRSTSSGTMNSITTAASTTSTSITAPATRRKHHHQNSHQLAPQQCLGQGRYNQNTTRSLSRRLGRKTSSALRAVVTKLPASGRQVTKLPASGRLLARNQQCSKLSTHDSETQHVPSRRGKKHLPSLPVLKICSVELYRPVPSRR